MKKQLLTLLLVVLSFSTVSANHWNPQGNSEDYVPMFLELSVDGTLLTPSAKGLNTDYEIGVFINGNCRASVARLTSAAGKYHMLANVPTGTVADGEAFIGHAVTFHIYDSNTGVEYVLPETFSLTREHIGEASTPYTLSLRRLTAINMTTPVMEVTVGSTENIPYTLVPENASTPIFEYVCASPAITAADGKVTGVSLTADPVNLIMRAGGNEKAAPIQASILVRVNNVNVSVTGINVILPTATVNKGDVLDMAVFAAIEPVDASNRTINWTSSNPSVVSVAANGTVTAVGGGQAVLTGKPVDNSIVGENYSVQVTINVKAYIETLNVTESQMYVYDGDNITLNDKYTAGPADITETGVTWVSSDPTVVSINGNTATALKSGIATLTVSPTVKKPGSTQSVSAQILVTVWAHVTGVTTNPTAYTARVGEIIPVSGWYTVAPADAHDKSVTWSSDNPEVVSVVTNEEQVTVTALKKGNATLTVKTTDKSKTATIAVTVYQPITGISFAQASYNMSGRASQDIICTPVPADADIDLNKLSLTVTPTVIGSPAWTLAETAGSCTAVQGGFKWTLKARALGQGTVRASYTDQEKGINVNNSVTLKVGQAFNYTNGWSWLSIPSGDKLGSLASVNEVYGTAFREARSQENVYIMDSQIGIYGTSSTMSGTMIKILLNTESLQEQYFVMYDVTSEFAPTNLYEGWTWIYYPYQFDYSLEELDAACEWGIMLPEGTLIKSKSGEFSTLSGGSWTGTLQTLVAGQGYLVYCPQGPANLNWVDESALAQPESAQSQTRNQQQSIWQYDHTQYQDNMSIVAEASALGMSDGMTVGAFVNGECRGEGRIVDGIMFISVHGKSGENIELKAYNPETGLIMAIREQFSFKAIEGSLKSPVKLHATGTVTGVESLMQNSQDTYYDLLGRPVQDPDHGIYIKEGKKVVF